MMFISKPSLPQRQPTKENPTMAFEAFNYEARTSSFTPPEFMFRGNAEPNGEPLWEPVNMDDYITIPTGVYTLLLKGFSKPLTVPVDKSSFQNKSGPDFRDITSLEVGFVDGPGAKANAKFLLNFVTFSLHPRSKLAGLYEATVLGGQRMTNEHRPNFTELLDKPFSLYIQASDTLDDHGRPRYNSADLNKATPIISAPANGSYNWGGQNAEPATDMPDVPNF